MKAHHTPGPWKWGESGSIMSEATGNKIAYTHIEPMNANRNTRLIAAAPELLEACKAVLNMDIKIDMEYFQELKSALDKVTAAISKAEGGEPMC